MRYIELDNPDNGDVRCFNDLEFVNIKCWKCGTSRYAIDKYWKRKSYMVKDPATNEISDGYHTFEELYNHRRALTAALAKCFSEQSASWRSKQHHPDDNPMFEGGYFIVGINLPTGQISYHYKLSHWDDFSEVHELLYAPKWDGHTPADTVERLLKWAKQE